MVAIIAGNGLGLLDSSAFQSNGASIIGSGNVGTSSDSSYVNVANGNLILQSLDESLSGSGKDLQHLRTYNSLGADSDNNQWRWLGEKRVIQSGNTLIRTTGDGHQSIYNRVSGSTYTSSDGDGADDTIVASATGWIWTEGSSGQTETYDLSTGWIRFSRDTSGNQINYLFSGDKLIEVEDVASGQTFAMTYGANNLLTGLSIQETATSTEKRTVSYVYDGLNRLQQVNIFLDDTGNNLYSTRYTYHGNSYRVASIVHGDGSATYSAARYTYVNVAASSGGEDFRVATVTDKNGVTSFSYEHNITRVTDGAGNTWSYEYDGHKRLVSLISEEVNGERQSYTYSYDSRDNVTSVDDGIGGVITYTYDSYSNLVREADTLGNTITRVYVDNLLRNETRYSDNNASEQSAESTRYVYDDARRLRFVITPEGAVNETRYNAQGLVEATITYTQEVFSVIPLGSADTISLSEAEAYAADLDSPRMQVAIYVYDYRGNLLEKTEYANATSVPTVSRSPYNPDGTDSYISSSDKRTQYVYSAHGELLKTISVVGSSRDQKHVLNSFVYDGMGRLISTNSADGVTTIVYDDSNTKKVTSTNNSGLISVSSFDQYGRLTSLSERDTAVEASDRRTRYVYDSAGRLRETHSPVDGREYLFYDAQGRISHRVNGVGAVIGYTYENTNVTDELHYINSVYGTQWFQGEDELPDTLTITPQWGSRSTSFRYNDAGLLVTARGWTLDSESERYHYDGTGRLNSIETRINDEDIGNYFVHYFYDRDGQRIGSLDAAGYLTESIYDNAGQETSTIRYDKAAPAALWNSGDFDAIKASIVSQSIQGSLQTHSYYDGLGRLVGHVNEQGFLTVTVFNHASNQQVTETYLTPVVVTSASTLEELVAQAGEKLSTTIKFDAFGRVSQTIDADGTIKENKYDAAGRLVTIVEAKFSAEERVNRVQYNAFGEVVGTLAGVASAKLSANPSAVEIGNRVLSDGVRYIYDAKGRLAQTVDANGVGVFNFYDAENRLRYTVNSMGEVTETIYNTLDERVTVRQYANRINVSGLIGGSEGSFDYSNVSWRLEPDADRDRIENYDYALDGRRVTKTDTEGYSTSNLSTEVYNQLWQSIRDINDSATLSTSYRYDRRGLNIETRHLGNLVHSVEKNTYDAFSRIVETQDPLGRSTTYAYLNGGRRTIATNSLGQTVSDLTYDAFGRVITSANDSGDATRYSYDDRNRSLSVTTPEGTTITTWKNSHGEVRRVRDAKGNETLYTYTQDGQLDTVTDAQGNIITDNNYDENGRLSETIDARGIVTQLFYDKANRVVSRVVDPSGLNIRTNYTFDAFGKQIQVTEAAGSAAAKTTQYQYDRKGQLVQTLVDPSGLALLTRYEYDGFGRVVKTSTGTSTVPEQQVTESSYDALGRLVESIIDPDGLRLVTQYRYDAAGQLTRTIDANGNSTWYGYDGAGRKTFEVNQEGELSRFGYDSDGVMTYSRRSVTKIDTTSFGDIVEGVNAQENAFDQISLYVYDKNDRVRFTLVNVNSRDWVAKEVKYDANGNVEKNIGYNAFLSTAILNSLAPSTVVESGNLAIQATITDLAALQSALASVPSSTTEYDYDSNNRLVAITDALGFTERYAYDSAGNRTSFIDKRGVVTTYSYDNAGRKVSTTRDAGGRNIQTLYSYDALGQLTRKIDPNGNSTWYVFDRAGRNTEIINAAGEVTQYEFNNYGSVISTKRFYNRVDTDNFGDQIVGSSVIVHNYDQTQYFVYDRANRLIEERNRYGYKVAYSYDGVGNRVSVTDKLGVVTKSEFDAAGRVTRVIRDFGGLDITTMYRYDAKGHLTREIDANGNSTWYLRDALGQVTEEVNALGEVTAFRYDTNGQVYFTQSYYNRISVASFGDRVTATGVNANISKDQVTYSVYDALNRLRFTAKKITGWTLSLVESVYDGNGNLTATKQYTNSFSNTIFFNNLANGLSVEEVNHYISPNAVTVDTEQVYDAVNRKIEIKDALGESEYLSYDSFGNLVRKTDKLGTITAYTYDHENRLSSVTHDWGGLNLQTLQKYNSLGQKTREIDANGNSTWFAYDYLGRLMSTVDAEGGVTRYIYDRNDNVIRIYRYHNRANVSNFGDVVGYTYVPTHTQDQVTYKYYDSLGRERFNLTERDNNNNHVLNEARYDAFGNVIEEVVYNVNIKGRDIQSTGSIFSIATIESVSANADVNKIQITSYTYDGSHQLVKKTDALGNEEHYTYDALGNKVSYTNQLGHTWSYRYDLLGRVTDELQPRTHLYYFRSDGTTLSDGPRLVVTQFDYDILGRIVARKEGVLFTNDAGDANAYTRYGDKTDYNSARISRYEYDALGRQTKTIHAGFYSETQGRFLRSAASAEDFQRTVEVFYDANGNAIKNKIRLGFDKYVHEYKVYDSLNRVTYEVDTLGYVSKNTYSGDFIASTTRYSGSIASYTYTGGRIIYDDASLRERLATLSSANSRTIHFEYDKNGQKSRTWGDGVADTRIIYDAFGNVIKESTEISSGRWAHNWHFFDLLNRNIASIDPEGYATALKYDAVGNLVDKTEYGTRANIGGIVAGDIDSFHFVRDDNERLFHYKYDAMNRQTRVQRSGLMTYFSHADDDVISEFVDDKVVVSRAYYDAAGNVIKTKNAFENDGDIRIAYDALGRVTRIRESVRENVVAEGDIDVFLTEGVELHPTTEFSYDVFGNVIREYQSSTAFSQPENPRVFLRYKYDHMGNLIEKTDGVQTVAEVVGVDGYNSTYVAPEVAQRGGATGYRYDIGERVIAEFQYATENPDQYLTEKGFAYDAVGRQVATAIISETSTTDNAKRYAVEESLYNSFGEVTRVRRLDVSSETRWRDYISIQSQGGFVFNGYPVEYTLANYSYNADGRLQNSTDVQGSTSYTYDKIGNVLTKTSQGLVTRYHYDLRGKLQRQELPTFYGSNGTSNYTLLSPEILMTHDRWGNMSSRTDEAGNTTNYEYDHENRLVATITPTTQLVRLNGTTVNSRTKKSMVYNLIGSLVTETETAVERPVSGGSSQHITLSNKTRTYDRSGQFVMSEEDSTGLRNEYRYDLQGNRVATRNGLGTVYVDKYDLRGNKIEQGILRIPIAFAGEYYSGTTPERYAVKTVLKSYAYDAVGRLTKETTYRGVGWNGKSLIGNNGNPSWKSSNEGRVIKTYKHDMRGNIVEAVNESGLKELFTFDKYGRKTSQRKPYQTASTEDTWTYRDVDYYADQIHHRRVGGRTAELTYDSYGRLTRERFYRGETYTRNYSYSRGKLRSVEDLKLTSAARLTPGRMYRADDAQAFYQLIFGTTKYNKLSTKSVYTSDIRGNIVREVVTNVEDRDVVTEGPNPSSDYHYLDIRREYASNTMTQTSDFDEQGRIKEITGDGLDYLRYTYDAQGNRVKVSSKRSGSSASQTEINSFDSEGRMLVADGQYNSQSDRVVVGTSGTRLTYDAAGRRVNEFKYVGYYDGYEEGDDSDEAYNEYSESRHTYNDLGFLITTETRRHLGELHGSESDIYETGDYRNYGGKRFYNLRGDLIFDDDDTIKYLNDGRVHSRTSSDAVSTYTYNNAGVMTQNKYTVTGSNGYTNTYTYSTAFRGGVYQQTHVSAQTTLNSTRTGTTTMTFNSFGRLVETSVQTRNAGVKKNTSFIYNTDGQIVEKQSSTRQQNYAFVNKQLIAGYGDAEKDFFDSGYERITAANSGSAPSSYTLNVGETLSTIAQSVFGDASLWYLIANANNLSIGPTESISNSDAGRSITIPNVVTNVHNNASTFKTYNPADIIGDITPSVIQIPPPPPPKKSCNVLKTILIVVVVAVVTYFTAGAATAAVAPMFGVAAGTSIAAGTAAVTVGSVAAAVVGGAVGGFVGSIVGQALSNGVGGIRIKNAFSSAIAGGLTAGLGEALRATKSAVQIVEALKDVGKGAAGYAASYVSNEIVGINSKFNWTQLAIGAVAGGVGGRVRHGTKNLLGEAADTFTGEVATGFFSGTASSYVASVLTHKLDGGAKPDIGMIAADAFGNALGSAIGARITMPVVKSIEKAQERHILRDTFKNALKDYRGPNGETLTAAQRRKVYKHYKDGLNSLGKADAYVRDANNLAKVESVIEDELDLIAYQSRPQEEFVLDADMLVELNEVTVVGKAGKRGPSTADKVLKNVLKGGAEFAQGALALQAELDKSPVKSLLVNAGFFAAKTALTGGPVKQVIVKVANLAGEKLVQGAATKVEESTEAWVTGWAERKKVEAKFSLGNKEVIIGAKHFGAAAGIGAGTLVELVFDAKISDVARSGKRVNGVVENAHSAKKLVKQTDLSKADLKALRKGKIPKNLHGKTVTSDTGLKVKIDNDGTPVEWQFAVGEKGRRGSNYSKVNAKGEVRARLDVGEQIDVPVDKVQRGHLFPVQHGADKNPIDDGPLNIVPQSSTVNQSNIKRLEKHAFDQWQGENVIMRRTPDNFINIQVPGKNVNVTYDPLSTTRWEDGWWRSTEILR